MGVDFFVLAHENLGYFKANQGVTVKHPRSWKRVVSSREHVDGLRRRSGHKRQKWEGDATMYLLGGYGRVKADMLEASCGFAKRQDSYWWWKGSGCGRRRSQMRSRCVRRRE
jgi:hypothetical protein